MTDAFLGQITMAGFSLVPRGYALCNGQIIPISQNQALFSLIGTIYGGNGTTNFGLPDLRGRAPLGYAPGSNYPMASQGGQESVTLTNQTIPQHNHFLTATTADGIATPATGNFYARNTTEQIYAVPGGMVPMAGTTVGLTGSNQPHPNMQPYRTINFVIALQGIYPTRS